MFIHGNLASNNWWKPTIQLLQSRYKGEEPGSAAFGEWLGCGQSSAPQSAQDLDMKSMARDYVAMCKGLGLREVNLVGHSTGGLIALCALLEEPDLFRKVVLLDPVGASGIQFGKEMYDAFTKMSEDRGFCDSIMASTIHRCDVNNSLNQQLFKDAFSVHPMIWHGIPDALKQIDIRSDLGKIRQPTLVLHGEFDQLLPVEESKAIAKGVEHGEFVEIKGQGHACNVENPQKFVDLMCEFLFEE